MVLETDVQSKIINAPQPYSEGCDFKRSAALFFAKGPCNPGSPYSGIAGWPLCQFDDGLFFERFFCRDRARARDVSEEFKRTNAYGGEPISY